MGHGKKSAIEKNLLSLIPYSHFKAFVWPRQFEGRSAQFKIKIRNTERGTEPRNAIKVQNADNR